MILSGRFLHRVCYGEVHLPCPPSTDQRTLPPLWLGPSVESWSSLVVLQQTLFLLGPGKGSLVPPAAVDSGVQRRPKSLGCDWDLKEPRLYVHPHPRRWTAPQSSTETLKAPLFGLPDVVGTSPSPSPSYQVQVSVEGRRRFRPVPLSVHEDGNRRLYSLFHRLYVPIFW